MCGWIGLTEAATSPCRSLLFPVYNELHLFLSAVIFVMDSQLPGNLATAGCQHRTHISEGMTWCYNLRLS